MDHRLELTTTQLDRATGVLVASAAGDALGAGYEFDPPNPELEPEMLRGIGNTAPGGWTDDTAQAIAIARVAATGIDLRTDEALTLIARGFTEWFDSNPPDVGIQTAEVLRLSGPQPTVQSMTTAAQHVHELTGRSAGNGSLMRTGPVAIAYLHDPEALVEASMKISALTHHEAIAQEACAVWGLAIRHTVINGDFPTFDDIAPHCPNRDYWREVFNIAEQCDPMDFTTNGWAVGALQTVWSAIHHTPLPADGRPACVHLQHALATVIRVGHDTDTTAAIAGQLLGARWGASAVPARWRTMLHGWPGDNSDSLERLATLIVTRGQPLIHGWPLATHIDYFAFGPAIIAPHPHDAGVLLGSAPQLDDLPDNVNAVISLCLLGTQQPSTDVEHVSFRLVDSPDVDDNPNLESVLLDIAHTIRAMRSQGRVVFVHCVRAESRTPAAALAYSVKLDIDLDQARADLHQALPNAHPNNAFQHALDTIATTARPTNT